MPKKQTKTKKSKHPSAKKEVRVKKTKKSKVDKKAAELEVVIAEAPVKGKRGRPRKVDETETPVKKKRGRPKKEKVTETPVKKKRGRPKKTEETQTLERKKTGRPEKAKAKRKVTRVRKKRGRKAAPALKKERAPRKPKEPSVEIPLVQDIPTLEEIEADDPNKQWYVVHTYSGYEYKVRGNLMRRIESLGMQDKIFRVIVPTEEEIEFKDGKRKTVQKKIFPGYVLVQMDMTEASWYVVRNTAGVTGFVGPRVNPIPIPKDEVKEIFRRMGMEAPSKVQIDLEKNQGVRIIRGPFKDFSGLVEEVNSEKEKVKVLITIFGRETPVELDFSQIEKL